MYEWSVEIYEEPLTDPEIWEGTSEDYEDAIMDAGEMAEAPDAYQVVITITNKGD